jgi:hypothetical protein
LPARRPGGVLRMGLGTQVGGCSREHRRTTQEGQGRTMLEAPQPLMRDWHAGSAPVLGTSQTLSQDGHRVYCVGSITAGPEKRKDYY